MSETKITKLYATPFGSGCGANLHHAYGQVSRAGRSQPFVKRAGASAVNMWWNGTLRAFDLLVLEFGKENR